MRRVTSLTAYVLFSMVPVAAHEIGTSRVAVVFDQHGSYDIELQTDAGSLVEKLQSTSGLPLRSETRADLLTSVLKGFDESFRRRVNVRFDAFSVRPNTEYTVTPPSSDGSPTLVNIHLRGRVPAGARQFSWSYGWTFATYALTIRNAASGKPRTEWIEGGETSAAFTFSEGTAPLDRAGMLCRYLTLGFTHILPNGLDHMLFVLGIYLLSGRPRSVFYQVSAFTVAHSITLGLSMYGVVTLSPKIVEPLIALSICYVAIENIFLSELKAWRIALVFSFGLLHGMGFAGALKDLSLPRSEFLSALMMFNVGVEAGQLAVIGIAFLLVGWYCSSRTWYRPLIAVPASLLIACIAVYWTFERLA